MVWSLVSGRAAAALGVMGVCALALVAQEAAAAPCSVAPCPGLESSARCAGAGSLVGELSCVFLRTAALPAVAKQTEAQRRWHRGAAGCALKLAEAADEEHRPKKARYRQQLKALYVALSGLGGASRSHHRDQLCALAQAAMERACRAHHCVSGSLGPQTNVPALISAKDLFAERCERRGFLCRRGQFCALRRASKAALRARRVVASLSRRRLTPKTAVRMKAWSRELGAVVTKAKAAIATGKAKSVAPELDAQLRKIVGTHGRAVVLAIGRAEERRIRQRARRAKLTPAQRAQVSRELQRWRKTLNSPPKEATSASYLAYVRALKKHREAVERWIGPCKPLSVRFSRGQRALGAAARASLDDAARCIKSVSRRRLYLSTQGDPGTSPGRARSLAEARAKAVLGYLKARGVDSSRVTVRALKPAKPPRSPKRPKHGGSSDGGGGGRAAVRFQWGR